MNDSKPPGKSHEKLDQQNKKVKHSSDQLELDDNIDDIQEPSLEVELAAEIIYVRSKDQHVLMEHDDAGVGWGWRDR
ncbi:hypothetical protein OIU84_025029 [Salix udensis]|uniref:Uncharacterized protein n=1 Tax=Salix udensis TaxID=889485 RepID=A0AAD6KIQ2_9ROSI|nr:hypothetical protein OIU84_025029 [Salix udensis]